MPRSAALVLVAEPDEDHARRSIAALAEERLEAVWAGDTASALGALDRETFDGLVVALGAVGLDGLALLRRARSEDPDLTAVLLVEGRSAALEAAALRLGPCLALARPPESGALVEVVRRALARGALTRRLEDLESGLEARFGARRLVAHSRAMARAVEHAQQVAPTRASILIEGERGTGKALLARVIHRASRRAGRFVSMDCASLEGGTLEALLLGSDRASSEEDLPAQGRIEIAEGGTLLLEGVETLPAGVQVQLLRLLQERTYVRARGSDARRADVRIIGTTESDLAGEVSAGRFRGDLLERLAVARITLPPLRERREDFALLVERLLRERSRERGRRAPGITSGALERLAAHAWPGNVLELGNTLETMIALGRGRRVLDLADLPPHLRPATDGGGRLDISVGMTVAEAERALIAATLRHTGNDKARAAELLGIGLRTLYRKLPAG